MLGWKFTSGKSEPKIFNGNKEEAIGGDGDKQQDEIVAVKTRLMDAVTEGVGHGASSSASLSRAVPATTRVAPRDWHMFSRPVLAREVQRSAALNALDLAGGARDEPRHQDCLGVRGHREALGLGADR